MLIIDPNAPTVDQGRWTQEVDEDGQLIWVRRRLRYGRWVVAEIRSA